MDCGCWGGQLHGSFDACCPDFRPTGGTQHAKRRFVDKFCSACSMGVIEVPISRVCALPARMESTFKNGRTGGFWSSFATTVEGQTQLHQFRVVNNRQRDSVRPMLVVFKDEVAFPGWALPVPSRWNTDNVVKLIVTNGTLQPVSCPRSVPLKTSLAEESMSNLFMPGANLAFSQQNFIAVSPAPFHEAKRPKLSPIVAWPVSRFPGGIAFVR